MTGKYSVIFLNDGGTTRRWRMGPTLLRSLLFLLVLVPVVAAASVWLNWKLWQDLNAARGENHALRRQVESHAQTTARLANLEQFLRKTDPQGLGELVIAHATDNASEVQTAVEAAPFASTSATETDASRQVAQTPPAGTEAAAESSPASPPAAAPEALPPTAGAPAATNGAMDESATVPRASGEDLVDKGLARVENLNARRVGARSLRISFDLYNTEQEPQLAGKATFELILADGSIHPLDDHGDTTYRINRLKKIVGNPILPAEVTDSAGASIRVSVFNDDDLIYRVTTPLRQ